MLEGGGYDARADVFSLGVVVWEALSASLSNPLTSLDATRLRERLADPATHLPLPTVSLTALYSQSKSLDELVGQRTG